MFHTTFAKVKAANACVDSYKKMGTALGGITKYGKDTPIPLDKVLKICGLPDTIWSLRCTLEPSENILIEFACRCAEHTLHFFEDKYPEDKRPRLAIEAARIRINDKSSAAESAAWSAWSAESAAGSAESAAGSAEIKWQTKSLLAMLKEASVHSSVT